MIFSCQEQSPARSSPAVPPLPPSALQQWAGVGTEPRKRRWNFHCCQEKETWNSTFAFAYLHCKQKVTSNQQQMLFFQLICLRVIPGSPSLRNLGTGWIVGCGALGVTALCQLLLRNQQHSPATPGNNVNSYLCPLKKKKNPTQKCLEKFVYFIKNLEDFLTRI